LNAAPLFDADYDGVRPLDNVVTDSLVLFQAENAPNSLQETRYHNENRVKSW